VTAARRLVATAMERGSRDNVTALVVRHEDDQ
jgi:serine/threonine protein phosphatase PrpC